MEPAEQARDFRAIVRNHKEDVPPEAGDHDTRARTVEPFFEDVLRRHVTYIQNLSVFRRR
jgi:hypothetical protein